MLLPLLGLIPPPADFQDLFVSGQPDVPFDTYRIPALCRTRKGTLLAFAEGRRSTADQSGNAIVLRRRPAKAKDWLPMQIVRQEGPHAINNPCVLPSREGRVWLMFQRYPAGKAEYRVENGYDSERACLTFLSHSDDEGTTWSTPEDITRIVKAPDVRTSASGPGIGIELTRGPHKGRLLFPLNEGKGKGWDVFALYSDDHGKSWQRGENAPKAPGTQPNETQIAELADGSILMNARNQAAGKFRLQCRSTDGGTTWTTAIPVPELVDPTCMGSLARLSYRPDLLAFSNPNDSSSRRNGTLRLSHDGGNTWPIAGVIEPGSFGYSSLCPLPKGKLGILFETVDEPEKDRELYRIRYGELETPNPG
jgi:sialidase-1